MKEDILNWIYDMLSRQKFADWYGEEGRFADHISGNDPPTKAQILDDLARFLELD